MAKDIRLPQLGQTMEEGTIVNCLVSIGDEVKKGDVIFEVETDKATLEMECSASGFVKAILVETGETVPVEAPLMVVGDKDEEVCQDYLSNLKSSDAADICDSDESAIAAPISGSLDVEVPADLKLVQLPQLGQTMEEGTIVNCLVSVGDEVKKGDVIFEVETDKATLEMECSASGVVKAILVEAGETVPVDATVMAVGNADTVVSQDVIDALKGGQVAEQDTAAAPAVSIAVDLPADVKVIQLPQLGQTMEEGTIVNCLAEVGKEVKKGDVIFEVETDKATLEMECSADGVVKAILVEAGETVPVDSAVMVLGGKDTELTADMIASVKGAASVAEPEPVATPAPAPVAAPVSAPKAKPAVSAPAKSASGRIFASPRAKAKAKSLGVNLVAVVGSGTKGRIVEADVLKASAMGSAVEADTIEMPAPAYNLGDSVKISRIHKLTGDKMLESKQTIPCFYLNTIVDMTKLVKLRASTNSQSDTKISFNDFVIRAMGLAIKQFPIMAGQIAGDVIKVADNINIGLAIAVGDDLVAPVIKDVDTNSAAGVSAQSKDLIGKAKSGKLMPDDLAGGCCTLSNLGAFGIDSFIPIVIPGQCSIVGVGTINDTLVPDNGGIAVRKKMSMTISVDHKVANGAYAAQCLDYMKKLLEKPESLL